MMWCCILRCRWNHQQWRQVFRCNCVKHDETSIVPSFSGRQAQWLDQRWNRVDGESPSYRPDWIGQFDEPSADSLVWKWKRMASGCICIPICSFPINSSDTWACFSLRFFAHDFFTAVLSSRAYVNRGKWLLFNSRWIVDLQTGFSVLWSWNLAHGANKQVSS